MPIDNNLLMKGFDSVKSITSDVTKLLTEKEKTKHIDAETKRAIKKSADEVKLAAENNEKEIRNIEQEAKIKLSEIKHQSSSMKDQHKHQMMLDQFQHELNMKKLEATFDLFNKLVDMQKEMMRTESEMPPHYRELISQLSLSLQHPDQKQGNPRQPFITYSQNNNKE